MTPTTQVICLDLPGHGAAEGAAYKEELLLGFADKTPVN